MLLQACCKYRLLHSELNYPRAIRNKKLTIRILEATPTMHTNNRLVPQEDKEPM